MNDDHLLISLQQEDQENFDTKVVQGIVATLDEVEVEEKR